MGGVVPQARHGTDYFYKKYKCRCDKCRAAHAASNLAYYHNNLEKERSNRRKYYDRHKPEFSIRNKEARQKHLEERRARDRAYARSHKQQASDRLKLWRQTEKGRLSAKSTSLNHIALKRGAPGKCDRIKMQARWDYYGGACWMCGKPATEIDHVIPLSQGGTNWPSNLRPSCRSCNARKNNKTLKEYKEYLCEHNIAI